MEDGVQILSTMLTMLHNRRNWSPTFFTADGSSTLHSAGLQVLTSQLQWEITRWKTTVKPQTMSSCFVMISYHFSHLKIGYRPTKPTTYCMGHVGGPPTTMWGKTASHWTQWRSCHALPWWPPRSWLLCCTCEQQLSVYHLNPSHPLPAAVHAVNTLHMVFLVYLHTKVGPWRWQSNHLVSLRRGQYLVVSQGHIKQCVLGWLNILPTRPINHFFITSTFLFPALLWRSHPLLPLLHSNTVV